MPAPPPSDHRATPAPSSRSRDGRAGTRREPSVRSSPPRDCRTAARREAPAPRSRSRDRLAVVLALVASLVLSGCVAGGTDASASPAPPRPRPAVTSASHAVMPDLQGVNAAMARDALARRGLSSVRFTSAEPGVRFVVQSADWHVVRQSAAAGTTVATATRIELTVRKGVGNGGAGPPSGSATMPDVVGKNGDAALSAMRKAGCWKAVLAASTTAHQIVLAPENWQVTRQLVRPGVKFDPDSVVVLAVKKK